ncbi:hypothetical protein NX794_26535 [Streptomyces sp. LP11]|uniref:Lipoprotein n=1 Tax=Streptomyces pyxinicus TaxID=2970331 RepID=A0ABT2B895_9ACTN|nr:hypothetical protein [Streptomyces sp. LP11]MCS0604748.1 hypothetical protein [Streptomyces sp. LP11]
MTTVQPRTRIRRRLRSGTVVLGGVGLLATALTACSSDPDKRCVDRDSYTQGKGYKVVSDKNCKSGSSGSHGTWYYGGSKSGGYVGDGSFTKSGKGSGGVHRGGFGGGGKGGSGG